jgi:hypothetical protein
MTGDPISFVVRSPSETMPLTPLSATATAPGTEVSASGDSYSDAIRSTSVSLG